MKVIAELVMVNREGRTTVIQVQDNSSFSNFYWWYHEVGVVSRTSNRNNNTPGTMRLEEIPAYIDKHAYRPELKIADVKVNYYDRAKYEELISCPSDQLPGGLPHLPRQHITTFGEYCKRIQPGAAIRVTDEYRRRQVRRAEMFGWSETKAG